MDENLYSLKEFEKNIKAMKLLSPFIPKEQRKQLRDLEIQLDNFVEQTQSFNKNFSDSGWCAYESMSFALMKKANLAFKEEGLDAGEQVLLDYTRMTSKK